MWCFEKAAVAADSIHPPDSWLTLHPVLVHSMPGHEIGTSCIFDVMVPTENEPRLLYTSRRAEAAKSAEVPLDLSWETCSATWMEGRQSWTLDPKNQRPVCVN